MPNPATQYRLDKVVCADCGVVFSHLRLCARRLRCDECTKQRKRAVNNAWSKRNWRDHGDKIKLRRIRSEERRFGGNIAPK